MYHLCVEGKSRYIGLALQDVLCHVWPSRGPCGGDGTCLGVGTLCVGGMPLMVEGVLSSTKTPTFVKLSPNGKLLLCSSMWPILPVPPLLEKIG